MDVCCCRALSETRSPFSQTAIWRITPSSLASLSQQPDLKALLELGEGARSVRKPDAQMRNQLGDGILALGCWRQAQLEEAGSEV